MVGIQEMGVHCDYLSVQNACKPTECDLYAQKALGIFNCCRWNKVAHFRRIAKL